MNWTPFYFESDSCRGWIRTIQDWEDLKKIHPLPLLKKAKSWDKNSMNIHFFGFTFNCIKGKKTLEDFFNKNNMEM